MYAELLAAAHLLPPTPTANHESDPSILYHKVCLVHPVDASSTDALTLNVNTNEADEILQPGDRVFFHALVHRGPEDVTFNTDILSIKKLKADAPYPKPLLILTGVVQHKYQTTSGNLLIVSIEEDAGEMRFVLPMYYFPEAAFETVRKGETVQISGVCGRLFHIHRGDEETASFPEIQPRLLAFPTRHTMRPFHTLPIPLIERANAIIAFSHSLNEDDIESISDEEEEDIADENNISEQARTSRQDDEFRSKGHGGKSNSIPSGPVSGGSKAQGAALPLDEEEASVKNTVEGSSDVVADDDRFGVPILDFGNQGKVDDTSSTSSSSTEAEDEFAVTRGEAAGELEWSGSMEVNDADEAGSLDSALTTHQGRKGGKNRAESIDSMSSTSPGAHVLRGPRSHTGEGWAVDEDGSVGDRCEKSRSRSDPVDEYLTDDGEDSSVEGDIVQDEEGAEYDSEGCEMRSASDEGVCSDLLTEEEEEGEKDPEADYEVDSESTSESTDAGIGASYGRSGTTQRPQRSERWEGSVRSDVVSSPVRAAGAKRRYDEDEVATPRKRKSS